MENGQGSGVGREIESRGRVNMKGSSLFHLVAREAGGAH